MGILFNKELEFPRPFPEPTVTFKHGEGKDSEDSSKLFKHMAEILLTLSTNAALTPAHGSEVRAEINTYKEELNWLFVYLAQTNVSLIDATISTARANSAGRQINTRLTAIQNRIERMEQVDIPSEEKKYELVPALHSCEEILSLFRDQTYCLWEAAIQSTGLLLAFVTIYAVVIKRSSELSSSYSVHLKNQIKQVMDTIKQYAARCIEKRLSYISGNCKCYEDIDFFYIKDSWSNWSIMISVFEERHPTEIRNEYKCWLSSVYKNQFEEVIHSLKLISDTIIIPVSDGQE